jgi:hypothetical protein
MMSKDIVLNLTGKKVVDKEDVYITPDDKLLEKLNKLCQFKSTPIGDSISDRCDKYLNLVLKYCKGKEELKNYNSEKTYHYYYIMVDVPNYMVGTLEELTDNDCFPDYEQIAIVYPHYNKAGDIRANVYTG